MIIKKRLNTIVTLLLLALFGLIAIQVYWMKNAYKTEEEQFNQHVNQALSNVIEKLDKERYSEDVLNYMVQSVAGNIDSAVSETQDFIERRIDIIDSMISNEGGGDSILIRIVQGSAQNALKGIRAEARLIQEDVVSDSIRINNIKDYHQTNGGPSFAGVPHDDLMKRVHMMGDVLLRFLDPQTYQPAEKKINLELIDSMIGHELSSFGISPEYTFSVSDKSGGMVEFTDQNSKNFDVTMESPEYIKDLFPNDYSKIDKNRSLRLGLNIPDKLHYILKRIWWVFALSLLFIIIICYAFYYTVSTINRQKKLSVIKNDFINNMTHELKTPISTIALACEALNDPDFNSGKVENSSYINMIRDENVRLGVLVERVLQSSVIEKGELKTKTEQINLHQIISDVANKFSFQITKLGGEIKLDLSAENDTLLGDRVHLTNLVSNLIDNAVKYSSEAPNITIKTSSKNGQLILAVSDKGIGISKEFQKKIFDKLFRIPTGNVHDVKGFGLGLSYVKAIVEHHKGEISVDSTIGHGSTFTIQFPQKTNYENT